MLKFDTTYIQLPEYFYQRVKPSSAVEPKLILFNHKLAKDLGIESSKYTDEELAEYFSGRSSQNVESIALAYAGHQFGHFVPQLGDGRAVLLGEIVSIDGIRFDVQLKGSGITKFSRRGDGRSALGPVIREYIISEAMNSFQVPTTRALAAVLSGEMVQREDILPGGIFTRIAKSHIRVGTFQFFAANHGPDAIRILADYTINRHFSNLSNSENKYLEFFKSVSLLQAKLISHWMSLGFIHGVMNTDNTSICGETIDFGPCAFIDDFKFDKVFSSIDRQGRYAYKNQMGIAQWNLTRLAECLIPLIDEDESKAISKLENELKKLPDLFELEFNQRMISKFGFKTLQDGDAEFIQNWLKHLENKSLDFTNSFRNFYDLLPAEQMNLFEARLTKEGIDKKQAILNSRLSNPYIIPRNHQVEKAIRDAIAGDYNWFYFLVESFENPFNENEKVRELTIPPSENEVVTKTFCGT